MAVDPRYLTVERWTAETTPSLLQYGFVPSEVTAASWQRWAQAVKRLPVLGGYEVPDPRLYGDWRQWAFRLNEALYMLGL